MNRRSLTILCCLTLCFPAGLSPGAGANEARVPPVRVRHTGPDLYGGRILPIRGSGAASGQEARTQRLRIGARKVWLALDDLNGAYLKNYKLRGKGEHVEVWVADDQDRISSDLRFPGQDCRNDERVSITRRQIRQLVRAFDTNIYPKESRTFSKPPRRRGTDALLYSSQVVQPPFPRGYYKGEGDNIVVLVDNVRDDNFYDANNTDNLPYIAGFFSSGFNELHDRNVMTIDAYDWLHRTGATPPNEPVPGDNCASKPARPHLYESTFAHEYQHLLEYYEDANESNWVNEGLSDYAQTLTGYAKARKPITDVGFDSHIQCFLGWLAVQTDANPNPRDGGPENSLTLWEEQDGEVLCDYGSAYSMMELLNSRYGKPFMGRFHRHDANGLSSLDRLLATVANPTSAREVVHEWNVMAALDGILDDGARLISGSPGRFKARSLDAMVNWDNPDTHSEPGAPPNGADYVRLRSQSGAYMAADEIESITFDGGETVLPEAPEWSVASDPPGASDNPALHSGSAVEIDRTIIQEVTVPTNNATLSFDTWYQIEEGWDFGFVQVSTDGGRTYTSLDNATTTRSAQQDAIDEVHRNLPGFTGNSGCPAGSQLEDTCDPDWVTQRFDLSDYAGEDIVLAFRYISDATVGLAGWYVDDVELGNRNLSQGNTLSGWQTPAALDPPAVAGFTVQLIAYDDDHTVAAHTTLPLGSGFAGSLEGDALDAFLPEEADVVAAIVGYDEPTESIRNYAPYVLEVNGIEQPGGS